MVPNNTFYKPLESSGKIGTKRKLKRENGNQGKRQTAETLMLMTYTD